MKRNTVAAVAMTAAVASSGPAGCSILGIGHEHPVHEARTDHLSHRVTVLESEVRLIRAEIQSREPNP